MTYKGKFEIKKQDYDFYNNLLSLNFDDLTDLEMENKKAKKFDYIPITDIIFNNGNYVTIDIASGSSNYFDNICLFNSQGNELICSDCNYEINGLSLYYDNDIYDIEMIIID